ncbi:MAG: PD-(D/E)XK nuclease family protein [Bacteroidales bacterium]|nr:PD-(D/E)XK nuclease family protein [Bacteroidales bacterium]
MIRRESASFLEEVLDDILIKYPETFSNLCLITPNRRSQVFIKRYFQEKGMPLRIPRLFSIDDFIQYLAPYTVIDAVDLSFELYSVYSFLEGDQAQTFEAFLQWAPVLINDFNELDMHLGDANELFSYLSDSYAIKEWNLGREDLSDFQKKYLAFFHKLNDYYQYFNQRLLSKNLAYNGLSYRYVAEHPDLIKEKQTWNQLVFIGFNALTISEEKIFKYLYQRKQALIYWDVDSYYFSNTNQEAGLFLRKYAEWFSFEEEHLTMHFQKAKSLRIVAVPRGVGQAKIAAEMISEAQMQNPELNATALVLADETLLLPVLNSLDASVLSETNVTMGYPLKNTSAHVLFRQFLRMQFNAQRNQKLHANGTLRFAKDDIMQLINNPLIADFWQENAPIEMSIQKQLYWSTIELEEMIHETSTSLGFLFQDFGNKAETAIEFFQQFIRLFSANYQQKEEQVKKKYGSDWEAFLVYARLLNRLSDRIRKYGQTLNLQEFKLVFEQLLGNQSQSFHGEPLKGLQLMGLLETRLLDFSNLIILSANEDILPSGKMANSFIPVDIKRSFNLPTYQEKNAIFAYHFYRLIQRAKNITLTYSTTAGALLGGEKSRYITQLLRELPKYNPLVKISEQLYNFANITPDNKVVIEVAKTDKIKVLLTEKAAEGISPTAINTYISCPLKFYFRHLAKIYQPDEEESFIDDRILGNIIHHTLESLFNPFVDKIVSENDLLKMKSKLASEVLTQAQILAKGQQLQTGQNFLTLKSIEKYLDSYFLAEIMELKKLHKTTEVWKIIGLETNLERNLVLNDGITQVKISGVADRIDQWGNLIRVLDYKSGAVKESSIKKIDFDLLFKEVKFEKNVQLLSYVWLLSAKYPNTPIQSGIIALRNTSNPYLYLGGDRHTTLSSENLEHFEKGLAELVGEMFEQAVPFAQTTEKKNCQYCPYINLCLK